MYIRSSICGNHDYGEMRRSTDFKLCSRASIINGMANRLQRSAGSGTFHSDQISIQDTVILRIWNV